MRCERRGIDDVDMRVGVGVFVMDLLHMVGLADIHRQVEQLLLELLSATLRKKQPERSKIQQICKHFPQSSVEDSQTTSHKELPVHPQHTFPSCCGRAQQQPDQAKTARTP
jgi:hypothetical protein